MDDIAPGDYLRATVPWQSTAGGGPLLRGRRSPARAPMLHFLHGNGFCGGVYWPFLRGFLPDYGLFCHDIEGHGASEAPQRFSGDRALVARVPRVIAEHALPQPLVGIGHSYGAALTLAVAATNPNLFHALVLLDPIVLPVSAWLGVRALALLHRNSMAEAARRRRDRWPSPALALERLRNRGIYRGWREDALQCFVKHATRDNAAGERELCCPRELEASIFEHPVYPWHAFRRVRCPVLFLYGAGSYPFFPAAARKARRLTPQIEIRTLTGGHCFMQENPDAATALVRDFLRRHGL